MPTAPTATARLLARYPEGVMSGPYLVKLWLGEPIRTSSDIAPNISTLPKPLGAPATRNVLQQLCRVAACTYYHNRNTTVCHLKELPSELCGLSRDTTEPPPPAPHHPTLEL